jgi:hypothetical protein
MQVRPQYQKSTFSTIKYKKYQRYSKPQPPNISNKLTTKIQGISKIVHASAS